MSEVAETDSELQDQLNVDDDADDPADVTHQKFKITSYGADLSVFELVRKINKEFLIPPPFQRKYVWDQKQASRFIESLLLGLPVPGIFIFQDKPAGKQLIVDGQQRLLTLKKYKDGIWKKQIKAEREVTTPFKLRSVADSWEGKTFADLSEADQEVINDSVVHTTFFRQEEPREDDRSIYEVFERINTGGMKLSAQEIRACVSYGEFVKLLETLSEVAEWRAIYGLPSKRLKDQELILRFLALHEGASSYRRPMRVFLDNYLRKNIDIAPSRAQALRELFESTTSIVHRALGARALRPQKTLNAAVLDAVMCGTASRLERGPIGNLDEYAAAYDRLIADPSFIDAYTRATADEDRLSARLRLAREQFSNVP